MSRRRQNQGWLDGCGGVSLTALNGLNWHSTSRAGRHAATAACLLFLALLCSCGKSSTSQDQEPYQAASDPDPERAAENQLRQLLNQVNTRAAQVAAEARNAGLRERLDITGKAERDKYYQTGQYIAALRAAESAITNKMAALEAERDVLSNIKTTNQIPPVETSGAHTNTVADERTAETKLKARLLQLQTLTDDLLITAPPAAQLDQATRDRAETARDNFYSPEEYVGELDVTISLIHRKLDGLDAESAIYERALSVATSNSPVAPN